MPLMPADVEAKLVVERRRKQDGSSAAVTVWLPTKELEAWGHDVAFHRLGALAVLPLYSATLFGVGEDFSRSGRPPIRTRFLHQRSYPRRQPWMPAAAACRHLCHRSAVGESRSQQLSTVVDSFLLHFAQFAFRENSVPSGLDGPRRWNGARSYSVVKRLTPDHGRSRVYLVTVDWRRGEAQPTL